MVNTLYRCETAPISLPILQSGTCGRPEVPAPYHDRGLDLMHLSLDAR